LDILHVNSPGIVRSTLVQLRAVNVSCESESKKTGTLVSMT